MVKILLVVFLFILTGAAYESSIKHTHRPALADGLSWTFYNESCPNVEAIVKATLASFLDKNVTQAPGVLRLLFHDCFVQGCDASILLNGTGSELEDSPNLTIRKEAVKIIEVIKYAVEADCPRTVSCADILALAGSYAVYMAGGPEIPVPLGRRDSLTNANSSVVVDSLPRTESNLSALMALFAEKGFTDIAELVVLSGGHTFGISHCVSFAYRLYPTQDSTLNESFAEELYLTCPSSTTVNTTNLDIRTPNLFDNKYYVNLENGEVLFASDESLSTDSRSSEIVASFATNETLFFERFVAAMVKMVQLDVLTGSEGEVRKFCSVSSSSSSTYSTIDAGDRFSSSY
ncbi:hypothetical protein SUGI_1029690 [Cryptomeria japonica]|uniref:peroxidase 12 n=1 Tax=Cryptomeria japonica TaxID=3369 RepID=UPI0024149D38|nr:peroxidase 12 [Cryptomeria japonica]GLJ48825.1 hypothetical protein SUGI_1029690 [Cryptomeria japonica]